MKRFDTQLNKPTNQNSIKFPKVAKKVPSYGALWTFIKFKIFKTWSFYTNWKSLEKKHPHFGSTTKVSSMFWWITLVQLTFKAQLFQITSRIYMKQPIVPNKKWRHTIQMTNDRLVYIYHWSNIIYTGLSMVIFY